MATPSCGIRARYRGCDGNKSGISVEPAYANTTQQVAKSFYFFAQHNSVSNDAVDLVLGELVECRQTETTEPATQHEGSRKLEKNSAAAYRNQ